MDTIKALLAKYATPLLSKLVLRGLLYGTSAVTAKMAVAAPDSDVLTKVADYGAAIACALLAAGIDWAQHKYGKAQITKAAVTGVDPAAK